MATLYHSVGHDAWMRVRHLPDDQLHELWSTLLMEELLANEIDLRDYRLRCRAEREMIKREMLSLPPNQLSLW